VTVITNLYYVHDLYGKTFKIFNLTAEITEREELSYTENLLLKIMNFSHVNLR
jgi:hypothetical protein